MAANNRDSERETQSGQTTRRTVLKTAGVAIAGGGMVGSAAASDPEGIPIEPGEESEPADVSEILTVSDEIETLTNHYELLTLSGETVRSYVRQSSLSGQERSEALQALAHIRGTFPVVKRPKRDGRFMEFQLAPSAQTTTTEEDRKKFRTAFNAFSDTVSGTVGPKQSTRSSTSVSSPSSKFKRGLFANVPFAGDSFSSTNTMWYRGDHNKITKTACNQIGLASGTAQEIYSHADDPDDIGSGYYTDGWVPNSTPHHDDLEQALQEALAEVVRYPTQYHDPSATISFHGHSIDIGNYGDMPQAGAYEMTEADGAYYEDDERMYLGRATHYVQDSAQPLHVGMGLEQAGLTLDCTTSSCDWFTSPKKWLHKGSEELFNRRWGSTNLKDSFKGDESNGTYQYYDIIDREQALRDLASYSDQYSYDTYHRIMEEGSSDPSDWYSDTILTLDDYFDNTMNKCGLYVRGFIKEFY